jgi:hypothetical protein
MKNISSPTSFCLSQIISFQNFVNFNLHVALSPRVYSICSAGRFLQLFKTHSSPVYGLTLLEHPRAETDINGPDGLCVVHEFEEWHLQAAKNE